jgi:hypothetical protein
MNHHPVFVLIGLLTITGTLVSLRREHIRAEYSVSWLLVGIVLTALAAVPKILDRFARVFGASPDTFLLIAAGSLIAMLVFEISHVVSRMRDENVMLAQRVAILEYRIGEFDKDGTKKS